MSETSFYCPFSRYNFFQIYNGTKWNSSTVDMEIPIYFYDQYAYWTFVDMNIHGTVKNTNWCIIHLLSYGSHYSIDLNYNYLQCVQHSAFNIQSNNKNQSIDCDSTSNIQPVDSLLFFDSYALNISIKIYVYCSLCSLFNLTNENDSKYCYY